MGPSVREKVGPFIMSDALDLDVSFTGDYRSFDEAKALTTGYEAGVILERTRKALKKVVDGEAAYERDSVTFEKMELPYPLLCALLRVGAIATGKLSVLDFGGSLGSTYFHCRNVLNGIRELEWSIVEQSAHVECGRREFSNPELQFYDSPEECLRSRKPNVLLLSGVIQTLPDPWGTLRQLLNFPIDAVIIDRTPILETDHDRLTIERISPRIYPASYPAWFLSRTRLNSAIAGWNQVFEFDALDRHRLDGVEIIYKGMLFERRR